MLVTRSLAATLATARLPAAVALADARFTLFDLCSTRPRLVRAWGDSPSHLALLAAAGRCRTRLAQDAPLLTTTPDPEFQRVIGHLPGGGIALRLYTDYRDSLVLADEVTPLDLEPLGAPYLALRSLAEASATLGPDVADALVALAPDWSQSASDLICAAQLIDWKAPPTRSLALAG